jgi:RNA polymerase sigma factor (sigma-70 family)
MSGNSSNAKPEDQAQKCAAQIRAAIEEEHDSLLRSVAVLVARTQRRRWPEVMEIAAEILHEAVQEALKHSHRFDPTRSATAWIHGIAARCLLNRRRADGRVGRCIVATVLGDEAWASALEHLMTAPADIAAAARIDLEQALARISPDERLAIECRYHRGLDGEELASALGVSTPGAARVRVCRALQALRKYFSSVYDEAVR